MIATNVLERFYHRFLETIYGLSPNLKSVIIRLTFLFLIAGVLMLLPRQQGIRSRGLQAIILMSSFFLCFLPVIPEFFFIEQPATAWLFTLCFCAVLVVPGRIATLLVPTPLGQNRAKYILYSLTVLVIIIELFN